MTMQRVLLRNVVFDEPINVLCYLPAWATSANASDTDRQDCKGSQVGCGNHTTSSFLDVRDKKPNVVISTRRSPARRRIYTIRGRNSVRGSLSLCSIDTDKMSTNFVSHEVQVPRGRPAP